MKFQHVAAAGIISLACYSALGMSYVDSDDEDMARIKGLGTSAILYTSDYDGRFFQSARWCFTRERQPMECQEYRAGNGIIPEAQAMNPESRTAYYWVFVIGPYMKSYKLFNPNSAFAFWPGGKNQLRFDAPDAAGMNVGGQNSYGYNGVWLSPFQDWQGRPVAPSTTESIERPAKVVVFINSTFYVAAPDVANESKLRTDTGKAAWIGSEANLAKLQNANYVHYWKNLGAADWSSGYGLRKGSLTAPHALRRMGSLNRSGLLHAVTVDGRAVRLSPESATSDICNWSTDLEGLHPKCENK